MHIKTVFNHKTQVFGYDVMTTPLNIPFQGKGVPVKHKGRQHHATDLYGATIQVWEEISA
jgi:hypothetical protein